MAKRIKTLSLHLNQRNLKKIQLPSSVLQASMLLTLLLVKMRMRERILLNGPLHPVLSPSLTRNIQEQIIPLSRQDHKTHHLLETFLNFFLKKQKTKNIEMKFFCMLLQPLKY